MGNGTAQHGAVQSVLSELRSLERRLSSIHTVQREEVKALTQKLETIMGTRASCMPTALRRTPETISYLASR